MYGFNALDVILDKRLFMNVGSDLVRKKMLKCVPQKTSVSLGDKDASSQEQPV